MGIKEDVEKLEKDLAKKAKKISDFLKKALKYLRINDEKNMISLTNTAMILILYKIAMTPAVSFTDITALAIAVLGYQGKRIIESKSE